MWKFGPAGKVSKGAMSAAANRLAKAKALGNMLHHTHFKGLNVTSGATMNRNYKGSCQVTASAESSCVTPLKVGRFLY